MKYINIVLILTGVLPIGMTTRVFGQHQNDSPPGQETHFEAVHSEHQVTIRIDGNPEEVFSLFEPEGLQRWNRLWKALEPIHVQSGKSLAGSVYSRTIEGHGHDQPLVETRVVADHDVHDRRIRYMHFIPGIEAWEYTYQCKPDGHGGTSVTVSLIMTALSEKANDWVLDAGKTFKKSVESYVPAINAALQKEKKAGSASVQHSPKQNAFEPVAIEREYRIQLNGTPEEVFFLFEPEGKKLWNRWAASNISKTLFSGFESSLAGTMVFSVSPGHPGRSGEGWFVVAEHDSKAKKIRYVGVVQNVELVVRDIRCEINPHGGTWATIKWRVAGLSHEGNQKVQDWMDNNFEETMRKNETEINMYLKNKKKALPYDFAKNKSTGNSFKPLAIERRHSFTLPAKPGEVFALLSPENGNHWVKTTPQYLFGTNDKLGGAMYKTGHGDGWMIVGDYDSNSLLMRNVYFINQVEFLVEQVHCKTGKNGGTVVNVVWYVAGTSVDGNQAVQGFFDQHWDARMQSLENTYKTSTGLTKIK